MSNGPTQVASSFVDALKGQPLSLALVVMNILLLGYLYYAGIVAHSERQEEMKLLYQNRSEMAQLLYQCTPAEKK
jgi:cytochrome c oxidase assembly factor CtaG